MLLVLRMPFADTDVMLALQMLVIKVAAHQHESPVSSLVRRHVC